MTTEVSQKELDEILRNHVWASMGVGMIPVPVADIAGLMGVQLAMIKKLAGLFQVEFFKEAAEKIIISFLGYSLFSGMIPIALSAIKAIPFIGQTIGSIISPAFCGASTYATGKVLIFHFQTGGAILSLDPKKMKEHYRQMFKEGRKFSKEIKPGGISGK